MNKAIAQMDQAVQRNAALVEQAAAASESMDEQSRGPMKLMEFFKGGGAVASLPAAVTQERRGAQRP